MTVGGITDGCPNRSHWAGWDWRRLLRHAYMVFVVATIVATLTGYGPGGMDARAYWLSDLGGLYGPGVGHAGAFLYSPAFAQIVAPLTNLPWAVFLALITAVSLGALWYLVGPWAFPALLLFPVSLELLMGNVNLWLAAAIVAGFRHPWAWSLVLLTKVTPGVGLLWFLIRREWRSLGIALGATASIVAVSAFIAPHLWVEWFGFLTSNITVAPVGQVLPLAVPLMVRLPVAGAIVTYGALTDRPQTVPIAACIAQPAIWGWVILIGALPLMDWARVTLSRAAAPARTD